MDGQQREFARERVWGKKWLEQHEQREERKQRNKEMLGRYLNCAAYDAFDDLRDIEKFKFDNFSPNELRQLKESGTDLEKRLASFYIPCQLPDTLIAEVCSNAAEKQYEIHKFVEEILEDLRGVSGKGGGYLKEVYMKSSEYWYNLSLKGLYPQAFENYCWRQRIFKEPLGKTAKYMARAQYQIPDGESYDESRPNAYFTNYPEMSQVYRVLDETKASKNYYGLHDHLMLIMGSKRPAILNWAMSLGDDYFVQRLIKYYQLCLEVRLEQYKSDVVSIIGEITGRDTGALKQFLTQTQIVNRLVETGSLKFRNELFLLCHRRIELYPESYNDFKTSVFEPYTQVSFDQCCSKVNQILAVGSSTKYLAREWYGTDLKHAMQYLHLPQVDQDNQKFYWQSQVYCIQDSIRTSGKYSMLHTRLMDIMRDQRVAILSWAMGLGDDYFFTRLIKYYQRCLAARIEQNKGDVVAIIDQITKRDVIVLKRFLEQSDFTSTLRLTGNMLIKDELDRLFQRHLNEQRANKELAQFFQLQIFAVTPATVKQIETKGKPALFDYYTDESL